jgi:hypothetical protein
MQGIGLGTNKPAITIVGTTFEGYGLREYYYPISQFKIAEVLPEPAVRVLKGPHLRLVDGYVEVFGRGAKKTIPMEAMAFCVAVEITKLQGSKKKEINALRDNILAHFAEAKIPVLRHDVDHYITSPTNLSFRLPLNPTAFCVGRNLAQAMSGPKNNS